MKIILSPHKTPYFGQDFTIDFLIRRMGLVPVYLKDGEYDISTFNIGAISLIISRYPDLAADAHFIEQYGGQIPVVVHLHLNYCFLQPVQQRALLLSISKARKLLCNCKTLRDEYQRLFPNYRWDFVNNGIETSLFYPASAEERERFKKRHVIPKSKKLLCYTGRLNQAKGMQLLEQVLAFVSKSDQHFLIIQCIYLPKYKETIENIERTYKNVKILINQDIKAVRCADLHISTSLSETTSLVTLEALFSGVPVICTDVTAFYQEIESGYAPFPYFKKIKVKPGALIEVNGKEGLKIEPTFVQEIAVSFIQEIEGMATFTQEQRNMLGASFSASKFNSSTMLSTLTDYYERSAHH